MAVSVFSVANALGRMSIAFVPEELPGGRLLPRTHVLVIGCLATAGTCALDAVTPLQLLPYVSLATGAPACSLLPGCLARVLGAAELLAGCW